MTTRAPYRHGDLAAEGVRIGLALLEREPADALSLRRIAGEAGVTHKALYRHFGDKDALLVALAAAGLDALSEALQSASGRAEVVRAYVRFALGRPRLYALMMATPRGTEGPLDAATMRVVEAVRAALPGETDEAIIALWTLMHGGVSLQAAGMTRDRGEAGLAERLIRFAGALPSGPSEG